MKTIYLDYNATTPIDPRVAEAMMPYITEHFGNPSSGHEFGLVARAAVDRSREQVAAMLGCTPLEVIFTSGGSEANNHAIRGVAMAHRQRGNRIVISAIEHPAVTEVCDQLADEGFEIVVVPVDDLGRVDPAGVEEAVDDSTILVSVMHANNEVGTVQPIAEISRIAHGAGALVHSDCAQSCAKIPVNVGDLGVDLLTVAGHKIYAPKGIGALFIRSGLELPRLVHGGNQEMGLRAGTENVIHIVALGESCGLVTADLVEHAAHLARMRDRLEEGLKKVWPTLAVNGHPVHRLPNTASLSFAPLASDAILEHLEGVAASAGAACHADTVEISGVLRAMKLPAKRAKGTIRFSTGRPTTAEEIDLAVARMAAVLESLGQGA